MNRSLLDTGGTLGVVSQFTLFGDARQGRRPSYVEAANIQINSPVSYVARLVVSDCQSCAALVAGSTNRPLSRKIVRSARDVAYSSWVTSRTVPPPA